jgi:hypothetical protein
MASLVLSVVYATDQRRKHRLHTHHLSLSSVRAGVLGLQRVGDAGVNAILLAARRSPSRRRASRTSAACGGFELRPASRIT